jgi:hypothetical protein
VRLKRGISWKQQFQWVNDDKPWAFGVPYTVKGQSRSDSLLLKPYHWAKLFRGVVAIVPAYLAYMGETSLWSFLLHTSFGWEGGSSSLLDGSG